MPPPPHQFGVVAFVVNRLLRFENCGRGFERNPEVKFLTVGNAPLYAARKIGFGSHFSVPVFKKVIVFGSFEESTLEATPYLESFGCGERKHRFGQICLQPVEYGRSPTYGQTVHPTENGTTDGVPVFFLPPIPSLP